ncbi:hypothetical protein [Candidatus Sodalis pierantonius]|uniref:hypothetical protein n=1 Tax=Candidatus Sodalis pierantonii TaxID=1486991 RepID=UPI0011DE3BCA|nr:hypothetical protein [Candidatus Sodalis pierantonius]
MAIRFFTYCILFIATNKTIIFPNNHPARTLYFQHRQQGRKHLDKCRRPWEIPFLVSKVNGIENTTIAFPIYYPPGHLCRNNEIGCVDEKPYRLLQKRFTCAKGHAILTRVNAEAA